MARWRAGSLSVVVPVFNEQENVRRLVLTIAAAIRPLGLVCEIVIVDDGSVDATMDRLRALGKEIPELVAIRLRRNFGQTAALQAGLDRARGDAIVTMDGDLQNDPADIPRLLEKLHEGADVVSGWRRQREDTLLLRKIPSWLANRMIRRLTGVPIHDQGCALKAYRREIVRGLDLYADMHRFIATLTLPLGASIQEIEVQHHARTAGQSKYGISRVLKVLVDLLTIQMLTPFRERPLHWFSILAAPFLIGALALGLAAFWEWGESVVFPTAAVMMGTSFISCILFGLIGEAILETADRERTHRIVCHELGPPE